MASMRSGLSNNTWYKDTLSLSTDCYVFELLDSDDDGISFWANSDGSGSCNFRRLDNSIIKTFEGDFGKSIKQQFTVGFLLNTEAILNSASLNVYPNPASDFFHVSYSFLTDQDVKLEVRDVLGRLIWQKYLGRGREGDVSVDLGAQGQGIYLLSLITESGRLTRKMMISR